ncbi:hypothetical protein CRD36_11800 [Paremcibacter congregatus]|uniref:SnoaL-like domain-containing protein n=2 Tax=Paremcibacter congregatus TaxID=2043170 RepID=A0A2G4YQQ6_9PROT|nr:hypothetical protein CRD36_11800 [Paremcibacter congregatus]QDE29327.1 nuclear transport factor 2 family protein [Paremcibacter congregatus]
MEELKMEDQTRLEAWHKVVFGCDLETLNTLLADEVVFHTPLYLKPRRGKMAALFILSAVIDIFEEFTYHRELLQGDSWALEFSARIGKYSLKGVDLIRWNDQGQIVDFEVYIRPINGVQALGEAMYEKIKAAGMLDMIKDSSE